jgi:2-methylisocitrate lyase-like PEP mutase family enzyme
MIAHSSALTAATDIPVSADLENGYADDAKAVAETIRLAAGAGLAGCSIEDSTNRNGDPIYPMEDAVERIRAAAEAAHALSFPFVLTARCENYLHGRPDLSDTIERLQAYQAAGADVLYAPGLAKMDEIATLVRSVDRPVNVLAGLQGVRFELGALAKAGVKRVALAAFIRAAREMRDHGTFAFVNEPITSKEIADMLGA